MAVKIKLPEIPVEQQIASTDKVLVSYGTTGAARLVPVSKLLASTLFHCADDNNDYRLVVRIVDGVATLDIVPD